jgi:hypothetical protein
LDFIQQSETLKTNYGKVATAYPSGLTGISAITSQENQVSNVNNWQSILTGNPQIYFSSVIDSIFAGNSGAKAEFNKELTAYQKGAYFEQKQRFNGDYAGTSNSTDPSRVTLISELQTALTNAGTGVTLTTGTDSNGNMIITNNMTQILNNLKASMLAKMNAAMGVDSIQNGANKTAISGLNNDLLTQVADDFAEIKAFIDDIKDLGYNISEKWGDILFEYNYNNGVSMESQKSWEHRNARYHSTEPVTA